MSLILYSFLISYFWGCLVIMKIRLALNSQRSAYFSQVLGLMAPPLSCSPALVPMVLLSYIDFWPGPAGSSVTEPWGGRTRESKIKKIEQVGLGHFHKLRLIPSKFFLKSPASYICICICKYIYLQGKKWGRVSGKQSYKGTVSRTLIKQCCPRETEYQRPKQTAAQTRFCLSFPH